MGRNEEVTGGEWLVAGEESRLSRFETGIYMFFDEGPDFLG